MHSSRMRTVHCSGRLLGAVGVGCLPRGVYTPRGQTDTCENNLSATTVADGKNVKYIPFHLNVSSFSERV